MHILFTLLEMDDFTIVGCMNRKNMENETIKERFLGTIFGQAVGDALGLSTEFTGMVPRSLPRASLVSRTLTPTEQLETVPLSFAWELPAPMAVVLPEVICT